MPPHPRPAQFNLGRCVSVMTVHCNHWGALNNYRCPKSTAPSTRDSDLMDMPGDQEFWKLPQMTLLCSKVGEPRCWMGERTLMGKKEKRRSSIHLESWGWAQAEPGCLDWGVWAVLGLSSQGIPSEPVPLAWEVNPTVQNLKFGF